MSGKKASLITVQNTPITVTQLCMKRRTSICFHDFSETGLCFE